MILNRSNERCTYCAAPATTGDHVVPKAFFHEDARTATSSPSMVIVPSCRECNNSFSKHESDALPLLLMAGPANSAVTSIFYGRMVRGLARPEARGSRTRLHAHMKPVTINGRDRREIAPHGSSDVTFVIRKIIRGLTRHHELQWPISEKQIDVLPMNVDLPADLIDALEYHICDPLVFRYGFCERPINDIHSIWRLTFYETRTFVCAVTRATVSTIK